MADFIIDWKNPKLKLEPYIAGRGGIIGIAGCSTAACNSFIKIVRKALKEQRPGNICIQLNPVDASTHGIDDIIIKFEQKLGIYSLPNGGNTSVATGITAHGNVSINDIHINQASTPHEISRERIKRVDKIVSVVKETLKTKRISLILFNWHQMHSNYVEQFIELFWIEAFEEYVDDGFLMICAYETEDGNFPRCKLMESPQETVYLPPAYDNESRQHALEDITKIMASKCGGDIPTARVRADTLLTEWHDQPAKVYSGLQGHLLRMKSA